MIDIKISTQFPDFPLIRQTPGMKGIWNNCKFYIDQDIEACDYWLVYDGLNKPESVKCPPDNTILIMGEPPSIKRYNPKFLRQFSTIITCHQALEGTGVIHSQLSLPWHIGINMIGGTDPEFSKSFDDFKEMDSFEKTKNLSIISSDKRFTKGHRSRLKFVEMVKNHFGDDIDVFGRGIRDVPDKWDAIGPYRYHIAIENISYPDYFTEKLSDAFLGGSYPIYYGCTNIFDYFPQGCLTTIDIEDPAQSIENIILIIENEVYQQKIMEIKLARELILNKYNLFAFISNMIEPKKRTNFKKEMLKIQPESHFQKLKPFTRKFVHLLRK